MARIRRWKEKLLLAWFTLFTSVIWARPRSRTPEGARGAARTLLLTRSGGKRAWGVRVSASKPFVRAFSASAVPVALPVAVGAFAVDAGAMADMAANAAAASVVSSCITTSTCMPTGATPCSKSYATACCSPFGGGASCHSVEVCSAFGGVSTQLCRTCGHGTCGEICS